MKGASTSKAEGRSKTPSVAEVRGNAAPEAGVEVRHYAELLQQAILAAGLSVADVERRLGFAPNLLRRVLRGGADLKLKHILMVLHVVGISREQFFAMAPEGLAPRPEVSLEGLRGEFDALVQRMQTSEAKAAGRALFAASPRRLGQAALAASRRP